MKKFCSTLLALTAVILLLAGCTSVADEKKIQEDLTTLTQFEVLSEGEQIKSLEIEKRQTNKDYKSDVVWCNFTTEDAECRYEKSAVLSYTLYDEGGWILDNVSVSDQREWTISPLQGFSESMLPTMFGEKSLVVKDENDEEWTITEENIKSLTVDEHETDLEQEKDTVTVSLTLKDSVEEASGKITMQYFFDSLSGKWELESASDTTFTVSQISGTQLDVSENDLKKAVDGKTYSFGGETESGWFYVSKDERTITFHENEVENLTIEKEEVKSHGTVHQYSYSFDLVKPLAKFHVTAELPYYYKEESGWKPDEITFTLRCISADIDGEWKGSFAGTYGNSGTCTLTLQTGSEGKVTGEYAFKEDSGESTGSYKVEGEFDLETLHLTLTDGDWIEKSNWSSITKKPVRADLYPDESMFSGKAQRDYAFKVKK